MDEIALGLYTSDIEKSSSEGLKKGKKKKNQ